jgi:bacteriocin-like protein
MEELRDIYFEEEVLTDEQLETIIGGDGSGLSGAYDPDDPIG